MKQNKDIQNKKFILYLPSGAFTDVNQYKDQGGLLLGFFNQKFQNYLIASKIEVAEPIIRFKKIIVNVGGRSLLKRLKESFEVSKTMKEINPNVVLCWSSPIATVALIFYTLRRLLALESNKSVWIMKMDSEGREMADTNIFLKVFYHIYLNVSSILFDLITIETSCGYDTLLKYLIRYSKLKIVPNSIFGLENLKGSSDSNTLKEKDISIITSSAIVKERGLDIIIKAFIIVLNTIKNCNLYIFGPITDKSLYEDLLNLVTKNNLASHVFFMGSRSHSDFIEKLKVSTIYVSAAYVESFGIARLEAIKLGVPVICTPAGCAKSLPGCMIFEYGDFTALGNLLLFLIENEEERNKLSREAINLKVPTYDSIVKQLLELTNTSKY